MIDGFDPDIRFGLLTIRAQQNEVDVFEDTLKLVLPILFTYPSFIYTIECDNTPNRHLHAIVQNPSKAKEINCSKVFQKFEKVKKSLNKYITLQQTQENAFWDVKLIKNGKIDPQTKKFTPDPYDFFYTLGYIQKDTLCSRRRVKNITSEILLQGIDFYATHMKIDKSCKKNDWTSIKPQNAYSLITHFCETNNIDVNNPELLYHMNGSKYGFNQITSKQLKLTIAELKLNKNRNDDESKDELLAHGLACDPEYIDHERQGQYLQYLQRVLASHNIQYMGYHDNWFNQTGHA